MPKKAQTHGVATNGRCGTETSDDCCASTDEVQSEASCCATPEATGATGGCCGSATSCGDADACGSAAAGDEPGGLTFQVEGLDCAEEVAILKRAVGPLVGGEQHLAFDVLNGRMTILESGVRVDSEAVVRAVAGTGMSAALRRSGTDDRSQDGARRRAQAGFTAASGAALALGLALQAWQAGGPVEAALQLWGGGEFEPSTAVVVAYGLAVVLGARFVLPKAWLAARRLRPDMHLLMTIAVAGAIGLGEWFEAATVAFLFALSLALESWSVGRARRAISALLDLAPATARVKREDGGEQETPAGEVGVGALFVVRPGDRVPLDGRVVAGSSDVDQAPITGESVPVAKQVGDPLFAGTINGDGALEVESTRPAGDTTLARITRLVEQAHAQRGDAEQWVERFARVYTPAVIALAVGVCLVPPIVLGGAWADWFYRALVLLVVSCPCALVISTPVSVVAALASAARHGVLVKGGVFLELPSRLVAVAFDKTGTLTRGAPEVVDVIPLNGHDESELLERAAALEARSSHPLARAVVACATGRGVARGAAKQVRLVGGKGVTGVVDGEALWLGSRRYAVERGVEDGAAFQRAVELEAKGQSVIFIGSDHHVCGLLALADGVRPEAAAALADLRGLGVRHLVMLTGDNRETAKSIGAQVGVDEVHAELLPEDKVAAVDALVQRYRHVAMVGDGVNDAPAMARATIGIAMGAAGSDAAIETADVALMDDDLGRLAWLVRHSRRTLGVIRQNVVISIAVKAGFVGLTLAGMASLWSAIAADMGTSLLVVGNGLRMLHGRGSDGKGG